MTDDIEEIGSISPPFVYSKIVSWDASFSFSSSDKPLRKLRSPPFEFAEARWCLWIIPEKSPRNTSQFSCQVTLEMIQCSKQSIKIQYQVAIRDPSTNYYRRFNQIHLNGNEANKSRLEFLYEDCRRKECRENFNCFRVPGYYCIEVFCLLAKEKYKNILANENMLSAKSNKTIAMESEMSTDILERGMSLRLDMEDMLINGEDHNVTLNVSGKEIKAHRDVLRARSKVFRELLTRDSQKTKTALICIPDCDYEAFDEFLRFIYSGKIKYLNEDNMLCLYFIARKFKVDPLKEECFQFINLSLSTKNACRVIHFAIKNKDKRILEIVTRYFIKYVDFIIPSAEWGVFIREKPTLASEFALKAIRKLTC